MSLGRGLLSRFVLAMAFCAAVIPAHVNAAVITHFAQTSTGGAPAPTDEQENLNGTFATSSTSFDGLFIWAGTNTVQDAFFNGFAGADLGAARMVASSFVVNRVPVSGPLLPLGERTHMNTSSTSFGDTFTIFQADPNVAVSGGVARLTLNVFGRFSGTGAVDLASSFDNFGVTEAFNSFEVFGSVAAREVGSFDLREEAQNLDRADFATTGEFFAALTALSDRFVDKTLADEGGGAHSNSDVVDFLNATQPGLDATVAALDDFVGLFSVEIPLDESGAVFEWDARFFTRTILDASVPNARLRAAFTNTATVSLALPAGYAATSASGAFPQSSVSIIAVPEPQSLWVMLCGLALFGTMLPSWRWAKSRHA